MMDKKLQRRIREKGKMTQGKAEGIEVSEAFGGMQVMSYISNTTQGKAFIGNRIAH